MTEKNKGKNKDHFEHFQGRIACGKSKASSLDAWIPTGRHGGPSTHLKDDPDSSVSPSCVYVKSHGGHLPVSLETWISVATHHPFGERSCLLKPQRLCENIRVHL